MVRILARKPTSSHRKALDERMPSLRRCGLIAHSVAGDILAWDSEHHVLRATPACGSGVSRAWRPIVLPADVLRRYPQFLTQPFERQQQCLAACDLPADGGASASDLPFEVHTVQLTADGAMVALVGARHVAVVALHLLADAQPGADGVAELDADALGPRRRAHEASSLPICYAVLVGESGSLMRAMALHAAGAPVSVAGRTPPASAFSAVPRAERTPPPAASDATAIVSVQWHPLSCTHLLVLRACGALELFNLCADVACAEQSVRVLPPPSRAPPSAAHAEAGGAAAGLDGSAPDSSEQPRAHAHAHAHAAGERACALAVGPADAPGWAPLTVYVCTERGALYAVCPLVPRCAHARCHALRLARDVRLSGSAEQARWLRSLAAEIASSARDGVGIAGTADDAGAAEDDESLGELAAQGPLRVSSGSGDDDGDGGGQLVLSGRELAAAGSAAAALLLLPSRHAPHVLARAHLDGSVHLLLVAEPPGPCWAHARRPETPRAEPASAFSDTRRAGGGSRHARGGGGAEDSADARTQGRAELLHMQVVRVAWPRACVRAATADDGGLARARTDASTTSQLVPAPAARSWVELLADPTCDDRLLVRDCLGVHAVHVPWAAALGAFVRGEAEAAARADAPPDLPAAHGLTRPVLPAEAELLDAAGARASAHERAARGGGARADTPDADDAAAQEGEEGARDADLGAPFRIVRGGSHRPAGASSAQPLVGVRPLLLGACAALAPVGADGSEILALGVDGLLRRASLDAVPPPPPAGSDDLGPDEARADGREGAGGAADEGEGGAADAHRAHAARLRALVRAAQAGLYQLGGTDAAPPASREAALARAGAGESGLEAYHAAAMALKHHAVLPALELGAHAHARLGALVHGMQRDSLSDLEAEIQRAAARADTLAHKARFAQAYQANLTERASSLHRLLARAWQPSLSAEESAGALAVTELRAEQLARRAALTQLLADAERAHAALSARRGGAREQAGAGGASCAPRVVATEQCQELQGAMGAQGRRLETVLLRVGALEATVEGLRTALGLADERRARDAPSWAE